METYAKQKDLFSNQKSILVHEIYTVNASMLKTRNILIVKGIMLWVKNTNSSEALSQPHRSDVGRRFTASTPSPSDPPGSFFVHLVLVDRLSGRLKVHKLNSCISPF